jgi:hypothetical protein
MELLLRPRCVGTSKKLSLEMLSDSKHEETCIDSRVTPKKGSAKVEMKAET